MTHPYACPACAALHHIEECTDGRAIAKLRDLGDRANRARNPQRAKRLYRRAALLERRKAGAA